MATLRHPRLSARLAVFFGTLLLIANHATAASASTKENAYGRLPLTFEANRGQADSKVDYVAHGGGYSLFLTHGGNATLALRKGDREPDRKHPGADEAVASRHRDSGIALRMKLVGASDTSGGKATGELAGKVNYFIGNDPTKWRRNVPTYSRVEYPGIYPGIDLVYYGNQRQLEYDFVVAPGADPNKIGIRFEGAEKVSLDLQGNLLVGTRKGEVQCRKPVVYQVADGVRTVVSGSFAVRGRREVGFRVAAYDREQPLIIDPVLSYSTYLGSGSGVAGLNFDEWGEAIAVDSTGAAYVTGRTSSPDFPTTAGAFQRTKGQDDADAFVTKLNPTGTALVYSTFLGGNTVDWGLDIAVDSAGSVFLTGETCSADFPTTADAFQTAYASGSGCNDAFVAKLDAAGSALLYSTLLGGTSLDRAFSIAVDSGGSAYVTGYTYSDNFPTTSGVVQATKAGTAFESDAFVTKLNSAGSGLVFSTYVGGAASEVGRGIAIDAAGSAYVTGNTGSTDFPTTAGAFQTTYAGQEDVFVTKLDSSGASFAYSTYLAGNGSESPGGIAVELGGSAYVAGYTTSTNFPTTGFAFDRTKNGVPGDQDAFVTRLNAAGSALMYSSFLGGNDYDQVNDLATDSQANAYVTGETCSTDFPTTPGALKTANESGCDAFLTKLNSSGSNLIVSTYFGGSFGDAGYGIALGAQGSAYITGLTTSGQNPNDFPTTPGAFQTTGPGDFDAFVVKVSSTGIPTSLTVSPAASTGVVDSTYCLTATVYDEFGMPSVGVTVRFRVTFESVFSFLGSATTDATGQASFCYPGPALPGTDAITAFADVDGDGAQTPGEPSATAQRTWAPPASTPLCQIKITNGGAIVADNGDKATFTGDVQSLADGSTQGQAEYQDRGPVQRMNVRSTSVLSVVCEGSTAGTIYGRATIDGAGSFSYRIKVKDLGKPGKGTDTYWIFLSNLYSSGEKPLQGGNVQIERQ
jgi:hypothetical protein